MDEITPWEETTPPPARPRPLYAGIQGAGLGLVAGAIEALALAATGTAPLSVADRVVVGLVATGGNAVVATVVAGLLVLITGSSPAGIARALGGTAGLLAALYLWDAALTLVGEGRTLGAVVFALLPVLVAAVVFFNARFWLVRAARGQVRVPWIAVAIGLAGAGIAASVAVASLRETEGPRDGGPSVVLVTVEGLRAGVRVPSIEALAAEGIRFETAVTPATDARPATAAVLTGVHPLRLELLDDHGRLARGWRTVAEVAADHGHATAAFVPSARVGAGSGLAQGFAVFDDRYRPAWTRPRIAALVVGEPGFRTAPATVAAFEDWLAEHGDRPFFAWIDFEDGRRPPGGVELAGGDADVPLGRVVAALTARGLMDRTAIVVAGTHGTLGGAHEGAGNRTLYDDVVRVPLVVRMPEPPLVAVVSAQVRLMDVAPTLLLAAGLEPLDESEGIGLLDYGSGLRKATMWTTIVGRDLDGRPLLGLRNNSVKYVLHADGREELYDASTDPAERRDLSADQPETLERARDLLASDRKAFERLVER